ncbi:MAG: pyrroline-5-carboxylate reductase [Flavobacteriales bacterium]|nr:pyrroline-5-carboxylate reductase [Flavobacteriales bacterium]
MKIAIIGCGNMGLAYARSFRKNHIADRDELLLITRNEATCATVAAMDLGTAVPVVDARIADCAIVIIAVKPQDFGALAPVLAAVLQQEQVVLSIMAGITLKRLQDSLSHRMVVRAMPNAPAQIGLGVTAYTTAQDLTMRQAITVERLLNSTGRSVHLEDEDQLNAVTALSGSGPAYVFLFAKTLAEAGRAMGLENHVAAALVQQTMLGAVQLMYHSDRTPDELILAVTSKGGTTQAAFDVFRSADLAGTLERGILAAERRSKELSQA